MQVDYVKGWGKLKSASEVEVATAAGGTSTLATKNIIIATGSEVTPLPGVPVDERRYVVAGTFSCFCYLPTLICVCCMC